MIRDKVFVLCNNQIATIKKENKALSLSLWEEEMNSLFMGISRWKHVVDGSFSVLVFFSFFITTNLTAASSPLQEETCKSVFCGEGRCQGTEKFPFVECICNAGWTHFNNITSLPCVLPNCTIHSQCGNAAPPPTPPFQLPNLSDPCWNSFCGADGSCVRDGSDFKCQCSQGSTNFLNNPKFACFKKCNLGEDCKGVNLGFNEPPPPFASSPPLANSVSPSKEGLLCEMALCGEGRCQTAKEPPFFKCICNEGGNNFNKQPYLPCLLPNCTVDFHCGNGSPPPPPPLPPFQFPNFSDPCGLNICGPAGRCESEEGSVPKCQCSHASANPFGDPKLPCFKKCYLGADCKGVGIGFNEPPPEPTPNGYILKGLGKLYMTPMIVSSALVLSI